MVYGSHPQPSTNLLSSPVESEVPDAPGCETVHLHLLMENDFFVDLH